MTKHFSFLGELQRNYRMLAEGSKLSVLTVFRTNDISDYIPVTRGDMLDNGKNPDNAVMLLLCLTDSLLGCLPELYFPNSVCSRTFSGHPGLQQRSQICRFCTWLGPPALHGTFASWKATSDAWLMVAVRHSYGQQGHSNQVYKSLIYLRAQGALTFSSVAWLTDFSDAVKNPSTTKSFFKKHNSLLI